MSNARRFTAPVYGFKAAGNAGMEKAADGTFEAIVAVFGNVDHIGDRIHEGAFTESLKSWKASGDPIPVIFSHRWDDLDAHLGEVLDAKELSPGDAALPDELSDNGGLWVRAKMDLGDDEPFARRLWKRMKRRLVKEFSFAYDVPEGGEHEKDGVTELTKLNLIEVGPTLAGMNGSTALLSAKTRGELAKAVGLPPSAVSEAVAELELLETSPRDFLKSLAELTGRLHGQKAPASTTATAETDEGTKDGEGDDDDETEATAEDLKAAMAALDQATEALTAAASALGVDPEAMVESTTSTADEGDSSGAPDGDAGDEGNKNTEGTDLDPKTIAELDLTDELVI